MTPAVVARTRCAECDEEGRDEGRYDAVGCLDGDVYGYCGVPECGGLCENKGTCPCDCHRPGIAQ